MPRPHRIHVPGGIYHVTLRGNHRQAIFRQDSERALLNKIVARAIAKYGARVHAFCWMTNHLHMLVEAGDSPLARPMQQIASEYARAFQLKLQTTGHLFENRYHATLIDTDAYLLEAVRYVHQNPVRAGLVANARLYPWSSHAVYLGSKTEDWVTTDFALALFSQDRARAVVLYRAFVDELPPKEIALELDSLEAGPLLLGKPAFIKEAAATPTLVPLHQTIADGCRHFSVTLEEIRSPSRTARLVAARAWIARTALKNGAATITAIARELNRDESTLRSAVKRTDAAKLIEEAGALPLRTRS